MNDRVIEFMKKHQLIQKNATVLIGVSGGPDSMALLHFYRSIKKDWNLKIQAISVDHQLRGPESRADLEYVEDICHKWGISFMKTSIDVKGYQKERRISTQVAARKVRYQFFEEQMNDMNADYLALGHHGDDQVETILMALVRSTSTSALSGIPIKRKFAKGYIVRPFLCITKSDLINYCNAHGIQPRIDPSNQDTDYTRNYFRKYLIPIIKEKNNNIHTTVQRLSESLQNDEIYLQEKAKEMVNLVVNFNHKSKQASFLINVFKSYPLSLQRRAYHLILNYLYNVLPINLSYTHEDIFFSLLENNQGNTQIDFPNGLKIKRVYHEIIFSFTNSNKGKPTYSEILTIPGKVILPNDTTITASYINNISGDNHHKFIFNAENVALPLHIRTRKPGDRMSWKGLGGSKKVKDIFIDEKIPKSKRDIWPIVTDNNGKIIWLVGLRKAQIQLKSRNPSFVQLTYEDGTI